jgi:hypothetical protein
MALNNDIINFLNKYCYLFLKDTLFYHKNIHLIQVKLIHLDYRYNQLQLL